MITEIFKWLTIRRKSEQQFIPSRAEKKNAYAEICKALNFYAMTGYPKRTIEEIHKLCPNLSANGIGTRLGEMKRKGYNIACEYRPGSRCKQWWLKEIK